MYLICAALESLRSQLNPPWDSDIHAAIFVYALYPFHNIILCCSIYVTAAIAAERYLAVCKPVEYHNRVVHNGHSPWFRVINFYILPVIVFCIIINIPKFFELRIKTRLNETSIAPTKMRLNDDYIFFYHHYTRLLVTCLIPFFSLAFCNFRIYRAVKQRRGALVVSREHSHLSETENRQAILLILIVIMFLVCNTPRIFLTLKETFSAKQFKEDYLNGCMGLPRWLLLTGSMSHLLLTLNSSINFFIYCVMSSRFRQALASSSWWIFCTSDTQREAGIELFTYRENRSSLFLDMTTQHITRMDKKGVLITSL